MKTKKILSVILSIIMVLSFALMPAQAENTDITVFLNVTKYGQFVSDKQGNELVLAPVTLTEKESYTLDDVFTALHNTYYEGGSEAGYLSDTGKWGLYITKFWGDESGNFGYQVNGGKEAVMGLSHTVKDGDYIDVTVYKSTENYSTFGEYRKQCYIGIDTELTLTYTSYDENYNTVVSPCENAQILINGEATDIKTDANGKATLNFEEEGTYIISASKEKEVAVPAITAPVCAVTVKALPDFYIEVPKAATLFVGTKEKTHFVRFTEIEPAVCVAEGESIKYYFELTNNSTYNYRISGEDYITYGGTFKKTENSSLIFTEEQLGPEGVTKTTVDKNTSSNKGYNVADIYLNINPQGYLRLAVNDTKQIVSLRNWEAVNSTTSNYFIEPDYNYEVIDINGTPSDVVSVDENGHLTANKSGTAVVLVTYDAMQLDFGSGAELFGAIWPENTGVFVVTVDAEESGIDTGITINRGKNNSAIKLSGDALDAEHDCIYFTGDTGEYTFTPKTEDCTVYVANPVLGNTITYEGFAQISKNTDKSFTLPLKTGRNIVKLEKDGKAEYQIITAKKVNVTVNSGEAVHPKDALSIVFDKLYHPANKLAGVYNMNAIAMYTEVSGYDGKLIGASSAQYNFANNESAQKVSNILTEKDVWGVINYVKDTELVIPEDYAYDTFTLSGGMLYVSGWGDSYGNHRFITYETGKGANLNADAKLAYLGKLPDIEIPITVTEAELDSVTLNTENVKTEYFAGDKFDAENLIVTAVYADNTQQIATNYTITPEVLEENTTKVTVTYKGKTAEIPVTVTKPLVSSIEITTLPSKTAYEEGETFNPSGMVVSAVFENGVKKETTDYAYSPNKELDVSDTEMLVSYTGEDAVEGIESVTIPITVTEKTSGGSITTNTINVYVTVLGDDKHGEPSSEADTHTKKEGNLITWIPKTKVTLEKGSYVIDAVKKALSLNGIPYTLEDNYISEIKGLAEFDNGSLSGWMYTLNGKYPTLGINEQTLKNGNAIIFHYTDDYTVEKTGFSSNRTSGTGATLIKDNKDESDKNKETENKEETPASPVFDESTFSDVKKSDWHYESVKYVYQNSLMQGTENGFEPDKKMTRAELCTILWRMEKEPVANYAMNFADVESEKWYTEAIRWGASEKLISGYENGKFGTNDYLTREQIVTILYRYIQKKLDKAFEEDENILSYDDFEDVSEYAVSAMKWAVGAGIMNGRTERTINPKDTATRAEVATLLCRFCKIIEE